MPTKKILNLHEEVTHRNLREVCEKNGALVFAKIRAQRFPVIEAEVLSELSVFQLCEDLDSILRGEGELVPISAIDATVTTYEARYQPTIYGGIERTRTVET